MSDQPQVATCQQCGSGYILTDTYRDLLARRQVQVIIPVLCPTCFLTKGPQPKQRGQVKWFNPAKRYGFLIAETGEEVFFHQEQFLEGPSNGPRDGQKVRFHIHYPVKGPEALNVEVIEE
jgi:cold shock CspA family protein